MSQVYFNSTSNTENENQGTCLIEQNDSFETVKQSSSNNSSHEQQGEDNSRMDQVYFNFASKTDNEIVYMTKDMYVFIAKHRLSK